MRAGFEKLIANKAEFKRILGRRAVAAFGFVLTFAAALLLTSCGFIGDLFKGDRGLGENFQYKLTIDYLYKGGNIISEVHPVFFWVMPLDENGEVMQDPENPEGPPLAEVLISTKPSGSVSVVVPRGDYGVLAFVDEYGAGDLWIGDSCVIYDNRPLADGIFDPIEMSADRAISLQFDDSYEFHHIYITSPVEGETVNVLGSSMKLMGWLLNTEIIGDINITVNGVPSLPAYVSPSENLWEAIISATSLFIPGFNTITADASFQGSPGPYFDSFTVNFYCQ